MGFEINLNNLNKDKHKQQMEFLQEQIVGGTHKDYFLALNNEAGSGKTIYAEKALVKAAREGKRSVFCRKFIENCADSAKRINELYGEEVAIAIDHSNYRKSKNILAKYPIVVITHQKYIWLSKDIKQQEVFTIGREILVIDEEIDMVKPIMFSQKTSGEFIGRVYKFPSIVSLYEEITKELLNFAETNKRKTFFKPKNNMKRQIRELKGLLNANISNDYAARFDLTKRNFFDEVDRLEILLNELSVADNQVLYNFDINVRFWKLRNNILLDACADLNYIYKVSNEFKVVPQEKVFDHSNWCLHVIEQNACRTKKEKAINFYEEVNEDIERILQNKKSMVIIGGKNEKNKFRLNDRLIFIWFNNIVGKNDWMDADACYITLNPQIPFPIYILKYMFYSGQIFEEGKNWGGTSSKGVYRFRDENLELIRQTSLASEIYQALKRINRDNSRNADVYIINNDNEIIDKVKEQLENIKLDKYSLDIMYKKKSNKKETNNDKCCKDLIEVIKSFDKNTKYTKEWVREQIGFKEKKKFSGDILKRQEIIDCLSAENVTKNYRYFLKG